MLPRSTTCWGPSESSLKRDSFNDLIRHKTIKKTNVPLLLMKANVMGRTAMLSFPAVGDYTHTTKGLSKGPKGLSDAKSWKPSDSFRSFRSTSLSSIGMKSLRFSTSSQDGLGSIRQGTPVTEQRKGSAAGTARYGYMPPEAGRIDRKEVKLSRWLQSQVDDLYRKMDENADGRLTKLEAQHFFQKFGKISSSAMFSEVDENGDGEILPSEWRNFWEQVRGNGYSEEDISEELQQLMCGGVWVDFLDDRTVSVNSRSAPNVEKLCQ